MRAISAAGAEDDSVTKSWVWVAVVLLAVAAACGGSSVDAHRLRVLSRDPLAIAQAPETTP
jgi:hypothetical protein